LSLQLVKDVLQKRVKNLIEQKNEDEAVAWCGMRITGSFRLQFNYLAPGLPSKLSSGRVSS
jgi:hypothetical protein